MNNSKIRVSLKESCLKEDKVTFTPRNVVNLLSTNFSVDYNIIDTSNIMGIYKYFMKKHCMKCSGLLKIYLLDYYIA